METPQAQAVPPPASLTMEERIAASGVRGYNLFRKIGSPRLVVAPMVDQSGLAFRLLTRRYGAQLCYTPMISSTVFTRSEHYRRTNFLQDVQPQVKGDRPLVTQFCGHEPDTMLEAAKYVEPYTDAVDINCGCPQGIARKGRYGAYLLEEPDTLEKVVRTMSEGLSVPVTVKIRLLPSGFEDTLALVKRLVAAGAVWVTVHGRNRHQKGQALCPADWEAIRRLKEAVPVPVFANGGISCVEDVHRCMEETGCDGVMVSEAILGDPGLFTKGLTEAGEQRSLEDMAEEFLELSEQHPSRTPAGNIQIERQHMFKLLYASCTLDVGIRNTLANSKTFADLREAIVKSRALVAGAKEAGTPLTPWYTRHRALAARKEAAFREEGGAEGVQGGSRRRGEEGLGLLGEEGEEGEGEGEGSGGSVDSEGEGGQPPGDAGFSAGMFEVGEADY